jgi:RNA polymerase sigma factor (sigma-70 family)
VHRALFSFNQLADFGELLSMMRRIVRLRVIDFFRRQKPEDLVAEIPEQSDTSLVPTVAGAQFTMPELLSLISRLGPPLPDLFHLRFVQGLNTSEIADLRQIKRNTVLSHFHRGFQQLRSWLERSETT